MDESVRQMDEEEKPKKSRFRWLFGLIIPLAVLYPIWAFFIGPQMRHDRLVEKGVQTEGRLVNVEETGNMVNDAPELKLTVEFKRKDGKLDTASTDFVPSIRTVHMYQPGNAVKAAYDPEDPKEVTVVEISDGPPASAMQQNVSVEGNVARTVDSLKRVADSMSAELQKLKRH